MKIDSKRFDFYRPYGDLADAERSGLIACNEDFDLGTPNWDRDEDIAFVASNTHMKQCLLVRMKWRPNKDKQLVTLISKMELTLGEDVYEFEQVDTYKPSESTTRLNRIKQYGSNSSQLKYYIYSPYRRSRLVFNGHLRKVSTNDSDGADSNSDQASDVFVKLSCVVNPLAKIYDFNEQYDNECLKQIYASKKPKQSIKQITTQLLLHDRHEQKVRLTGECLIIDHKAKQTSTRTQEILSLWGFYIRHFVVDDKAAKLEQTIKTKRVYGYMSNGQAFHIGTRKSISSDLDEIDFGYTSFHVHPKTDPIDKPFKLDWRQVTAEAQTFQLEISGHGHTFECRTTKKNNSSSSTWFQVKMNGNPGWAWVSLDDSLVDTQEQREAIAKSQNECEQAISAGQLVNLRELDLSGESGPLVVSIDEDMCCSSNLVGSKASSLAQLLKFAKVSQDKQAYRVPFAFVLTKFAHDAVLSENKHLQDAIDELQQFVGQGDVGDTLATKCKIVQDLVAEQSKLPQSIRDELWKKLTEHYGLDKIDTDQLSFAVRSSSWGEDEDDMSAAGQLSTILNVKFNSDLLARAIMACFASKFSCENIEYKRQHGMPLDLPMAIVVQEMISCQKAGVMFTCDPTTGDESIVTITANYGLGESVVSAQADPDTIIVRASQAASSDTKLDIDQVLIGKKNVIISAPSGNDAHDSDQSTNYDKSKCCLSDEEILILTRCGLEVKRYFWSQRRDIEWGYLGGQLYLFQSRPVTGQENFTLHELMCETDRPLQAEFNFSTRANIGEVMPYPVTPLSLTFTVFNWNTILVKMLTKFTNEYLYVPQCSTEVFHEKYHAFFNLRCSMMLPLSDKQRTVLGRSMEIGIFGREMGVQKDIVESARGFSNPPNPFSGTRFDLFTLPLKLMPARLIMKEKHVMDKLRGEIRSLKLATGYESNKMLGLYNQLKALVRSARNALENHMTIIIFASNYNIALSAALSKYIKDPMQLSSATNKFLAISPDVISAEIPERVKQMAKVIASRGEEELKTFIDMPHDKALEYLSLKTAENKQLSKQFEDFIERFGHRCYNEFELAESAWREKPELVVEMIRTNCSGLLGQSTLPDSTTGDTSGYERPKTIDQVLDQLNLELTFKDKLLIKHVLAPRCQLMLSMREKTKSILILYHDVLREASRMLASEMQRQLRIPDKDLFYYLMFDEVEPLIRAHQPGIVCQATRRRQMFKRMFSELWKFDEIITEIEPNHMRPTRELDEALAQAPRLFGTPASSGKVQGKICLVGGYKELNKIKPGSILLTHSTDIAFSPVFPLISGIITEVGGLISHGAVVAREYGLPSVIGIPDITRILQDGEEIILDADNGTIIRLDKSSVVTVA